MAKSNEEWIRGALRSLRILDALISHVAVGALPNQGARMPRYCGVAYKPVAARSFRELTRFCDPGFILRMLTSPGLADAMFAVFGAQFRSRAAYTADLAFLYEVRNCFAHFDDGGRKRRVRGFLHQTYNVVRVMRVCLRLLDAVRLYPQLEQVACPGMGVEVESNSVMVRGSDGGGGGAGEGGRHKEGGGAGGGGGRGDDDERCEGGEEQPHTTAAASEAGCDAGGRVNSTGGEGAMEKEQGTTGRGGGGSVHNGSNAKAGSSGCPAGGEGTGQAGNTTPQVSASGEKGDEDGGGDDNGEDGNSTCSHGHDGGGCSGSDPGGDDDGVGSKQGPAAATAAPAAAAAAGSAVGSMKGPTQLALDGSYAEASSLGLLEQVCCHSRHMLGDYVRCRKQAWQRGEMVLRGGLPVRLEGGTLAWFVDCPPPIQQLLRHKVGQERAAFRSAALDTREERHARFSLPHNPTEQRRREQRRRAQRRAQRRRRRQRRQQQQPQSSKQLQPEPLSGLQQSQYQHAGGDTVRPAAAKR